LLREDDCATLYRILAELAETFVKLTAEAVNP